MGNNSSASDVDPSSPYPDTPKKRGTTKKGKIRDTGGQVWLTI